MHTPAQFDSDLNPKNKSSSRDMRLPSLTGGCGFESPICNEWGDCRIKFARANKAAFTQRSDSKTTRLG